MSTSYSTVLGQGNTIISVKPRGTLAAATTETFQFDNLVTDANATPKDNVDLNAWVEVGASATAGVKLTWMPLNAYMNGVYSGATHHLYAQDISQKDYSFSSAVLNTTISDGTISGADTTLDLANVTNLTVGDLVIFNSDIENAYTILAISGTTVTLDRALSGATIIVATTQRAVRRQGIKIPIAGVPCLGWLIMVENLDASVAATVEILAKATTGSTLV